PWRHAAFKRPQHPLELPAFEVFHHPLHLEILLQQPVHVLHLHPRPGRDPSMIPGSRRSFRVMELMMAICRRISLSPLSAGMAREAAAVGSLSMSALT